MSSAHPIPLWEFPREHLRLHRDKRTRIIGGVLTGILYAVCVVLAWLPLHVKAPARTSEITAIVLPDRPKKRVIEPLPFLARLSQPRVQSLAPPVITIAPPAEAPALLTLPAGSGNGQTGQGSSGAGGNGGGSGCLDAAWMRAVTGRVRQFFYYPPAALAVRKTGLVMVHFEVRRNGQIEKLGISKSSGDAGLDKAALDIVQKAQPLPPIPDRMHTERVEGELPINFGVRSFNASSTTGTCG